MAYLLARGRPGSAPARFAGRLALFSLYWQFVDVVWIVLFTTIYLF